MRQLHPQRRLQHAPTDSRTGCWGKWVRVPQAAQGLSGCCWDTWVAPALQGKGAQQGWVEMLPYVATSGPSLLGLQNGKLRHGAGSGGGGCTLGLVSPALPWGPGKKEDLRVLMVKATGGAGLLVSSSLHPRTRVPWGLGSPGGAGGCGEGFSRAVMGTSCPRSCDACMQPALPAAGPWPGKQGGHWVLVPPGLTAAWPGGPGPHGDGAGLPPLLNRVVAGSQSPTA